MLLSMLQVRLQRYSVVGIKHVGLLLVLYVAWSGYGLVKGNGWMPDVFTRSLASVPKSDWDFKQWAPHAVVINLGTNDQIDVLKYRGSAPETQYQEIYLTLVRNITKLYRSSSDNSGPYFFLACGPVTDAYCPHVLNVINILTTEDGINATFLDQRDVATTCCDHPNTEASVELGSRSAFAIRKALGWR
jgi:hypothetical protein